jgi:hypothetical protein
LVTVNDTEDPVIDCPPNDDVNNDATLCGAVVTYDEPKARDNCAGVSFERTAGPASGNEFPVGTTTIEFKATDNVERTRMFMIVFCCSFIHCVR